MTGSRRLMLGEAMSILARRTWLPSGCLPSTISWNSARFSAFAVGAVFAGFGECAAIHADVFGALAVHVGEAFVDELPGIIEQLREVVAGVAQVFPVEAEPVHVALDARHVFFVFFFGVGVVKAQVAIAVEALGHVEVEADGFDVAEVQVAVGFGREAGDDVAAVFAVFQVFFDDVFDEVGCFRGLAHVGSSCVVVWLCRAPV